MNGFRAAGGQEFIVGSLLTRAWCFFAEASFFAKAPKDKPEHRILGNHAQATECEARAQADLDEAWQIAERGSMKLHMADIHLHRARLFRDKSELAKARAIIEASGYWRRKEELEDAEAVATNWPDELSGPALTNPVAGREDARPGRD